MGILPHSLREKPIARILCRRLAKYLTRFSANKLKKPVLVVGFHNSGKSTIMQLLHKHPMVSLYPDEGNGEFWFPGFFPWVESGQVGSPIWFDPEEFVGAVLRSNKNDFYLARSYLGAYQWLVGGDCMVNDSGMSAAILPNIYTSFPDAKYIHIQRDGRVVCYLAAREVWSSIMRQPARFKSIGLPLDFHSVLRHVANYWAFTLKQIEKVATLKQGMIHEVSYESWCKDPNKSMQEIFEFLEYTNIKELGKLNYPIENFNEQVISEYTERDKATIIESIGPILTAKGYMWDCDVQR